MGPTTRPPTGPVSATTSTWLTSATRTCWLLTDGDKGGAYNLGNGLGFTVREVIETVREVSGRSFRVTESDRRPGDPGVLVAEHSLTTGLVAETGPA